MKRFKACVCVLLACLLCVLCCGCDVYELSEYVPTPAKPTVTTTTLPSVDMPLVLLENGYAYTKLDAIQQANYKAVVKELYDKRGQETMIDDGYGITIALPHELDSEDRIKELFDAVRDDHPEFFYLTNQYGWMYIGDRMTDIRFYYIWGAKERAAKAVELEAAVSSLVTQAQSSSPVEQELLFHDELVIRNEYATEAALDDGRDPDQAYHIASSPYAALCTGAPICGGYSRAFQLLLRRVGIESTIVSNEDHMWTMLWLDGEAYHTDVTWDDPVDGVEGYWYFNITDKETSATRDYPAQLRVVPRATATTYNFYVMNGWYLDDLYDGSFGEIVRSQIESGNEYVHLKFDAEDYDAAVDDMFDGQVFFDAVYELEDDALRDTWYAQVYYLEYPKLGVIDVYVDNAA